MAIIRVTKEFTFEMAHALLGYDGSCKYVHGHSYGLSVTVSGQPVDKPGDPKLGMVIDFGDLKRAVKESVIDLFDHALVLNKLTPHEYFNNSEEIFDKVMFVDYQPTSENLIIDFQHRIMKKLPPGIKLHSLKLRETGTSFVEWHSSDN
jgi:6-pyruvoyltetrahydropterin/6-carboxytetrahydropterin synthase